MLAEHDDYFTDDTRDPDDCPMCDEYGMIVVCWDDLCHGAGECMHGDGMAICECQVTGHPPAG